MQIGGDGVISTITELVYFSGIFKDGILALRTYTDKGAWTTVDYIRRAYYRVRPIVDYAHFEGNPARGQCAKLSVIPP